MYDGTWRRIVVLLLTLSGVGLAGCVQVPDDAHRAGQDLDEDGVDVPDQGDPLTTSTATSSPAPPTPTPPPTPVRYQGPPILVVDHVLVAEDDEVRRADPRGDHCGRAHIKDDAAWILHDDHERLKDEAVILITAPKLEGNWSTYPWSGQAWPVPFTLDLHVEGHNGTYPMITWNATTETAYVDGHGVALPFAWTYAPEGAGWHIDANLSRGPDTIQTWVRDRPCI